MSGPTKDKALEQLVAKLIEVLGQSRLRTGELLLRAEIADRKAGEAALWMLLKRGTIEMGPDSKLRLVPQQLSAAR